MRQNLEVKQYHGYTLQRGSLNFPHQRFLRWVVFWVSCKSAEEHPEEIQVFNAHVEAYFLKPPEVPCGRHLREETCSWGKRATQFAGFASMELSKEPFGVCVLLD